MIRFRQEYFINKRYNILWKNFKIIIILSNLKLTKLETMNSILIHYGEISLKGKNQPQFRKKLLNNILISLKSIGIEWPLVQYRGYLLLSVLDPSKIDLAQNKLAHVLGINWYSPAKRIEYSGFTEMSVRDVLNHIEVSLCNLARRLFSPEKSFRVDVRRSDKRFPGNSVEMERIFGSKIQENTPWQKVDLKKPDQTFYVEIQSGEVFIHSQRIKGAGGLPVNTAQKVIVMLSGGIDSPVAAYLVARRGCHVDFVHFTASHVQAQEIYSGKIGALAAKLSEYTLNSRLFILPSTYFDMAITGKRITYELVLFRRFMVRVTEKLAEINKMHAIITGDNLSQVASQTLTNLASTNRAVEMPIIQPVITYEKEDIINLAIKIDTYENSIQPYKDCCSLFQRNPKTVSKHEELINLEKQVFTDCDKMIRDTLNDMFWLNCRHGKIEAYRKA
jgi:thiamine biosynthesis protein ThiI